MIRPVEMQMLFPRTESVGTMQQHENQSAVNSNMHAASEVAKEAQHNSEVVIQKDANEFNQFKYDARDEGKGAYQNPQKKRKKDDKDELDEQDLMRASVVDSEEKKDETPRVNIQI